MFRLLKILVGNDVHFKDLVKGSFITFLVNIFGMLISYYLYYVISQKSGPEGVGYYSLATQILFVLAMVLGLGINTSVLRFVGQFNNPEEIGKLKLLFYHFMKIVTPLSIIAGVILFFGSDTISNFFDKGAEYSFGLKIIACILPLYVITHVCLEYIRGLKKLLLSELLRTVLTPLIVLIGILLLYHDASNFHLITLIAFATVFRLVLAISSISRRISSIEINESNFTLKELIRTSIPMMTGNVSLALMTAMPLFILDYYASEKDVGIFSIAFRISILIAMIVVIVNTISAPKFSELYWSKRLNELQSLISKTAKLMFWSALILSLILSLNAEFFMSIFGDDYVSGKWSLILLIIGQFVNVSTGSVNVLLNMSGHQRFVQKVLIISLPIILIGYLLVAPTYGMLGVAFITALKSILVNVIMTIYSYRKLNIRTFHIPFIFIFNNRQ